MLIVRAIGPSNDRFFVHGDAYDRKDMKSAKARCRRTEANSGRDSYLNPLIGEKLNDQAGLFNLKRPMEGLLSKASR